MSCTTILVGKKASYDGSTLVARNDDSAFGKFHVKKMCVKKKNEMGSIYKSKISHLSVKLPKESMKFTYVPNVKNDEGIWGAAGINELNVSMSATETLTSNPRVLGADPYIVYDDEKHISGGIGEEDLVMLILPYIKSAREGVTRLASLLEKYGTYEPNGVSFSDENEIWYFETIGGHHFIAKRVEDDRCVIMPNQLGIDDFDFKDAFSKKEKNICSSDIIDFIKGNHLYLNSSFNDKYNLKSDEHFNPRLAFGSASDSDHVYNTPRAWIAYKYFCPKKFKEEKYTPESDDLPWSYVPERKITIEDVKYILSNHYQGTEYDPYSKDKSNLKLIYRPIGISRTAFMSIAQIRPYVKNELKSIQWVCFASNVFNTLLPVYANVDSLPFYVSNTTGVVDSNNFYWASRLLGALTDSHFQTGIIYIERYQNMTMSKNHQLIKLYDDKFSKAKIIKSSDLEKVNQEISDMIQKETNKCLNEELDNASLHMKNGFARSDN